jgi:GNAT superfamily N-acetyltransferase
MDALEFRLYEPADLGAVHELIHRTIDSSYSGVYPTEAVQFFKRYHSREAIAERAQAAYTVLVVHRRRIVATGSLIKDHVTAVFVDASLQRQGIGAALMKRLEEHASASGVRSATLDASLPAKRFYDALGYVTVEEASRPVENGQTLDFYRMRKALA